MTMTRLMQADDIASGFNGATERQYWRASVAGSRLAPEVHFNSRASMVRVSYRIATGDFSVAFNRSNAAFGDFLASVYRSLEQVLAGLKAAGLPFAAALDPNPVLRVAYDPRTKDVVIHVARAADTWADLEPTPKKVPVRIIPENVELPVDAESTPE